MFPSFAAWFQQEYKVRTAEQAALEQGARPIASDTAAVARRSTTSNPQDFIATECVSHILVDDPGRGRPASAPRIVGGRDFAAQARQYSTDTGERHQGRRPRLHRPRRLRRPRSSASPTPIPVNQLSQPVHTQFGWHLIEVTSRQMQPLDADQQSARSSSTCRRTRDARSSPPALKTAKVKVNPAYGSWDPLVHGVAPPVPPPSARRRPRPATGVAGPSAGDVRRRDGAGATTARQGPARARRRRGRRGHARRLTTEP